MQFRIKFIIPVVFSLLCLAVIVSANFHAITCFGASKGLKKVVFSLDVRDEPLAKVLEKISKATGYEVKIHNKWHDLPITAKMENVTLEKGLKRIFAGFDHALIIQDKKKIIKIFMHGPMVLSENQKATSDSKPIFELPTEDKLRAIQARQKQLDPKDIVVQPPKSPGQKGVTLADIQAIQARQKQLDPKDIVVQPPKSPGQKGVTLADIQAIKARQQQLDPNAVVLPLPKNESK